MTQLLDVSFLKVENLVARLASRALTSLFGPEKEIPESARTWMKHKGRWVRYVFGICALYSISHLVVTVLQWRPEDVKPWSYVAHAVIIIIAFFIVILDRPETELDVSNQKSALSEVDKRESAAALDRAKEAARLFLRFWPFLWFSWFLLYLTLAGAEFLVARGGFKPDFLWFASPIYDLLNNVSALIIFSMYYELTERTVDEKKPENVWMIASLITVLLFFSEMVLTIINRSNPAMLGEVALASGEISGLLTGIATALLTTRLASRLLSVPVGAIVFLMAYALVQPLFPMVASPKNQTETVIGFFAVNIALYGKATLLVVVHWLYSSHRLSYYMVRALQLSHEEDGIRARFLAEFLPAKHPARRTVLKKPRNVSRRH